MHVDAPSSLGLWLGGHHSTPRIGPFSTACAGRGLRRMWGHRQYLGLMEGPVGGRQVSEASGAPAACGGEMVLDFFQ